MLATTFGGDVAAKATIISRLVDGVLEGRADILLQEADIGRLDFDDIWRSSRAYPLQSDKHFIKFAGLTDDALLPVPAGFFTSRENEWVLDPALIFWPLGRFVGRRLATFRPPLRLKRRIEVSRVETRPPVSAIPRSESFIRRAVSGLRFRKQDIDFIAAGRPNMDQPADAHSQGRLPQHAKPNDYVYEKYAHDAARIIRNENVLRAAAFRRVTSDIPEWKRDSAIRAVRYSFELMYDKKGVPHQN